MLYRICVICALAMPFPALAQLVVQEPWVRASAPGQAMSAAYMKLSSPQAVRVVGASSPLAGVVELHETRMEQGVMKMLPVPAIEIPAGGRAELKPGGYHLMLMELKHAVKEGESVPLTVVYELAGGARRAVEVTAPVRPLAPTQGMGGHSGMGGHPGMGGPH